MVYETEHERYDEDLSLSVYGYEEEVLEEGECDVGLTTSRGGQDGPEHSVQYSTAVLARHLRRHFPRLETIQLPLAHDPHQVEDDAVVGYTIQFDRIAHDPCASGVIYEIMSGFRQEGGSLCREEWTITAKPLAGTRRTCVGSESRVVWAFPSRFSRCNALRHRMVR